MVRNICKNRGKDSRRGENISYAGQRKWRDMVGDRDAVHERRCRRTKEKNGEEVHHRPIMTKEMKISSYSVLGPEARHIGLKKRGRRPW